MSFSDVWPYTGRGYYGGDPECFVKDGKGKVIPAFKFLKKKEELMNSPDPKEQVNFKYHQTPYIDGFQAEWCIPPARCLDSYNMSFGGGLEALLRAARGYDASAKLSIDSI